MLASSQIASLAHSQINLWQGSYTLTENDKILERLKIKRQYSSRSLYKGWFGFGWCSDLDYKISQVNKNNFSISHCGRPLANATYTLSPQGLVLRLPTLLECYLHYTSTLEPKLLSCGNEQIIITFNSEDQIITQLASSRGHLLTYSYQNLDLIRITALTETLRTYTYNNFHNLTQVRGERLNEDIQYNDSDDTVARYKDRENCTNQLSYHENSHRALVQVQRNCPTAPSFTGAWAFNSLGKIIAEPRQQPASISRSSL